MRWQRLVQAAAVAAVGLIGPAAFGQAQMAQQPLGGRAGTEWYRDDPATAPAGGFPAPAPVADPAFPGAPVPQPVAPQPAPAQPAPRAPVAPAVPLVPGMPMANPAWNQRPYLMPPIGGAYNGYGSTSGLFPSNEMNSFAVASARQAMARALFRQAEGELNNAYRAAQRQFEQSVDYRNALREERDAWDSLNAARARVVSQVASSDNKYRRLVVLRDDLAGQLETNRVRRNLSQDEVNAISTLKMSYATEIRGIESAAMANDSAVDQARERLVNGGARVSALRQGYANALRESPEILTARRNLDDARVARVTADAYYRAAMQNSAYAMDYAYYLYRRPNPYGQDSYGGGFR